MKFRDDKLARILAKTGGKCYYCGAPISGDRSFPGDDRPGAWNVDHLFPDGRNDLDNLVPSCVVCNARKGFMQPDDFFRLVGRDGPPGKPFSFVKFFFRLALWGFAIYGAHQFYLNHVVEDPSAKIKRFITHNADTFSRKLQSFRL
jgi:hypothetical protein